MTKQLTVDQARDLALDLLRQLSEHVGDPEGVNRTMNRWLDVLDYRGLSLVALAAVQMTFTHCLTVVPADEVPPGGVALTLPERTHA